MPKLLEPAAGYRLWAAGYPPYAHNPLMQAEERAMLSLLPTDLRGRSVLDAGCGTGRYMLHALRRGASQVAGADQSPEMLDRARAEVSALGIDCAKTDGGGPIATGNADRLHERVLLLHANLAALPLPDQWADLTVCALSLGHLTALHPALAELRRVTKVNGTVACSDFHPNGQALGWQRTFKSHGQRYAIRHHTHSSRDWQQACSDLNLEIVTVLEPGLDPRDIPSNASFDAAALTLPVIVAYHLRRTRR